MTLVRPCVEFATEFRSASTSRWGAEAEVWSPRARTGKDGAEPGDGGARTLEGMVDVGETTRRPCVRGSELSVASTWRAGRRSGSPTIAGSMPVTSVEPSGPGPLRSATMATHRDQPTADPDDPSAPLIVVNPRAARLADPRRRRDITAAIANAVLYRTGRPARVVDGDLDAAHAAIAQLASDPAPALVVVAGGDGTIRDAATALAGRRIPLAIVPGGTGNVLASALGLGSIRAGVEAIRRGSASARSTSGSARWGPVAAGAARSRTASACSSSAAGWAWTPRIMAAAQHEWKRRMRFGAYVGAAIGELTRLSTAVFRVIADGQGTGDPRLPRPRRERRRHHPRAGRSAPPARPGGRSAAS